MNTPILVVGAGPVGLTAALCLSRFGLPVRIIDSNDGPTTLSKALVLWRRSLITLDPMVPIETWRSLGIAPKGTRIFDQGAYKAELRIDNSGHSLPPGLFIPQSKVEAALLSALRASGVEVERRTTLQSFAANDQSVACRLEGPNGDETFESPYLFGCDGAHSTVRHALGLEFPGEAVSYRWLLGDIEREVQDGVNPHAASSELERTVEPAWVYSTNSAQGSLQIFPISDSRYRIFVEKGVSDPDMPRQDPTIEDLQAAIVERTRLQWRITDSHWLAEFRINERQVAQYVHGRVFLAGDAAHVHSPAGGQGMNTGLQDAANLAWKVWLTHSGAADKELLDTYQEERHPVAARVLKMSGRVMRASMMTSPIARGLQDFLAAIATSIPAVRKLASGFLAEDDVAYVKSSLAGESEGRAKAGTAFPDVPITKDGLACSAIALLRTPRGAAFTLVLMEQAEPARWPASIENSPLHIQQVGRNFRDPQGHLEKHLNLHSHSGVLVRPDAIIASSGAPDAIRSWIQGSWLRG
jgi:2-polyprenyl-6-methoxyphenol hydroxylase-like FAD-dependent oxidoreductase